MDGNTVLFVLFLTIGAHLRTTDLAKPSRHHQDHAHPAKPHPHHAHSKSLPFEFLDNDDSSDSSSESDSLPDNEVAQDHTFAPPLHYPQHFLDVEAEPPYFPHGPPPDVDFIGIMHHYSNATNLAFPPYGNGQGRRRGKKRSRNGPKHFERHHSRKGKEPRKSPRRHPGR